MKDHIIKNYNLFTYDNKETKDISFGIKSFEEKYKDHPYYDWKDYEDGFDNIQSFLHKLMDDKYGKNWGKKLLKESDIFDDEEWDIEEVPQEESPRYKLPYDDGEYVTTYDGEKIKREDAVWCIDVDDWCHGDYAKFSNREGEFYTQDNDEIIWVDTGWGGDYVHIDDVTYSERDGEYLLMDDAVYCEYEEDSCRYEDAVELENGVYAFEENVGEDIDGKKYHKDTLVWDDEKNGYIYNGD